MSVLARIAADALRRNALDAAPDAVLDLRADAWGHGADVVASVLRPLWPRTVVADASVAESLRAAGHDVADRIPPGATRIDPRRLYGLDGAGTPVMRLSGTVLSTKLLRRGEGVSYGYLHRADADTRIALVAGGYAQGVVRALGESASVSIRGIRCPILGRVAMDVCVVEIGDAPVQRGDVAWFFGDPAAGHPALAEWERATGLDAAELVAAVGSHAKRVLE